MNLISIPPKLIPHIKPKYPWPLPLDLDISCAACYVPETGPSWMDRSRNGNHGILNGVTATAEGRYGSAWNFDGVDDSIEVAEPPDVSTNLTTGSLFMWTNTTTPGGGFRGFVTKTNAYAIGTNAGVFAAFDYTTALPVSSGVSIADGLWHFTGMTFQSGVVNGTELFVDGIMEATGTITVVNQANSITIGANGNPASSNFANMITDEVMLFNKILSQNEITGLFEMGRIGA